MELETTVETLEQLQSNDPVYGVDILRAGLDRQRFGRNFGVEIPELDLDFETFRIDGTRRLAALVGTTALIAGVGAGTSVSEAAVSPQSESTVTCPNPYVDYQFYKKDFPSRPASAGSDLVILSNNQYAIPDVTVLNNYACVGQESKAEFGIENVGPESAQGSTITVSIGSPDAGIHIDRLINPDTKEPLANCQTDPNNQSLTCNLGDLAMYGMVDVEAQYHADPLAGSQGPKASSILASVQSSTAENYPTDNQITHPFNIYDQPAGASGELTASWYPPRIRSGSYHKIAGRCGFIPLQFRSTKGQVLRNGQIFVYTYGVRKPLTIKRRFKALSTKKPTSIKIPVCKDERYAYLGTNIVAKNSAATMAKFYVDKRVTRWLPRFRGRV